MTISYRVATSKDAEYMASLTKKLLDVFCEAKANPDTMRSCTVVVLMSVLKNIVDKGAPRNEVAEAFWLEMDQAALRMMGPKQGDNFMKDITRAMIKLVEAKTEYEERQALR